MFFVYSLGSYFFHNWPFDCFTNHRKKNPQIYRSTAKLPMKFSVNTLLSFTIQYALSRIVEPYFPFDSLKKMHSHLNICSDLINNHIIVDNHAVWIDPKAYTLVSRIDEGVRISSLVSRLFGLNLLKKKKTKRTTTSHKNVIVVAKEFLFLIYFLFLIFIFWQTRIVIVKESV